MRGSSLVSLEAVESRFNDALASLNGDAAVQIGQQLFAVVDLLDTTGALRRALTDPARDSAAKTTLVNDLLGSHASQQTVDVVADAATSRWSNMSDFADAIERLGAVAVLAGAQAAGRLEQVGHELWDSSQVLANLPQVRTVLSDRRADAAARAEFIGALFATKVSEETLVLITRAAAAPRGAQLVPAIQRYSDLVAERRHRVAARVIASAQPSAEQIARIESLLRDAYGQDIQVDVIIDPSVIGGIRIQVGSDILDSTVLARLVDIRRKIAS
ncbi:F-type H+-transporting ATPase subunit delta [Micrococcales bacterium KH10]|nr:F-type H+-transporting ATPase subunit delta [Micrococcales bacterium KH10]